MLCRHETRDLGPDPPWLRQGQEGLGVPAGCLPTSRDRLGAEVRLGQTDGNRLHNHLRSADFGDDDEAPLTTTTMMMMMAAGAGVANIPAGPLPLAAADHDGLPVV